MAVTIESELLTCEEKFSSLGSVTSAISNLTSKLGEINTSASTAVTSLTSIYTGDGLSKAQSAFASIEAAVDGIKASIPEGPEAAVSMAEALVGKIGELHTLKDDIDKLETDLNSLGGRRTPNAEKTNIAEVNAHNAKIDNLESQIRTKTSEFNTKQSECKSKLAELKALNPTIDITVKAIEVSVDSGTGEISAQLQNLKEGQINVVDYVGKNGTKVRTFIYVPPGASTTSGLAVDLSMGGDGAKNAEGSRGEKNHGRGGLGAGVGKQLNAGKTYSGIVVVLEAYNDHSYSDGNYLDTCKEIADNIVKTYNADANKVSINGYSYGGSGVLHMIERFPGYFSQAVIIAQGTGAVGQESSSKEEAIEKLKKTPIHYIYGTGDSCFKEVQSLVSQLESGGNVTHEWRKGGHEINTFYPITVNGKTYDNYVEFCLAQSKA